MQVIQLLHSPVFYIVLFLLSIIVAPRQYYTIIYRTLQVLMYIAVIPLIIVLATLFGVYEGLTRSEARKQQDRYILGLRLKYASELCKVGARCCSVPFKLLLFIPPIRSNFFKGLNDAARLKAFISNSQLSPNHKYTVFHPFRSFVMAIPALFGRGYRRYAPRPGRPGNAVKRSSRYGYKWVGTFLFGDLVRRRSVATTSTNTTTRATAATPNTATRSANPATRATRSATFNAVNVVMTTRATAASDQETPYNNTNTLHDILD